MANTKVTGLTENTDPQGSDLEYMVDDPAGTPASRKVYKGNNNLLPDGFMINGKLVVSVAAGNLTVALKTKSGNNPSATDPVSVWINGTYRRCTAALSVTKNAATNWCNAGSAELATKEIDFFPYLIWNTTPGTDIMDIGFSRFPGGRVYSDFSATTTNEKYLASGNASAPTATDDCVVVGRFAATLSAGAAYTWSVPAWTSVNLIQAPIYASRWLDYQPAYSANGAMTFTTVTTNLARYMIDRETATVVMKATGTTGGTASTELDATLPWEVAQIAATPIALASVTDTATIAGWGRLAAGTPDIVGARKYDNSNFGLGAGRIMACSATYEV